MFRFIYKQARTTPNLFVVGCKSNLADRKWATFYLDIGQARDLLEATIFLERKDRFSVEFSDRMEERVMPGGRDWDPNMSDAEATLDCDDKLELEYGTRIRAMIGDSIAKAINIEDFSKVDSSNSVKSTRHDPVAARMADADSTSGWECLDDTKIPSKTWDYVVARTSSSRKRSAQDISGSNTTTSRQGEE